MDSLTLGPAERTAYKNSTYVIVSKIAYLIGGPRRIFENEHEPPQLELFQQLENDKNARIIRHLCIIRTAIERNFKYINNKMRFLGQCTLQERTHFNEGEETKMRKKLLSALLIFCIALTLLPGTAFAAGELDITDMLQENSSVSYSDLPALFSVPFNELEKHFSWKNLYDSIDYHEYQQSGSLNGENYCRCYNEV